ncbi:MAG: RidA family protein [Actinobacteria bacterium]|nr:RidA family protein [Actinomycetota bacterium]
MTDHETDRLRRLGVGASLSQAVIRDGVVYLAGQVAEDGSTDALAQTRAVLRQIDARLAEAGTDRSRLLQVIVWLQDIGDFAAMNQAWGEWLGELEPPARATAEVKLADPAWRVEIIATAAIPG